MWQFCNGIELTPTDLKIKSFRRFLPADEGRKDPLVQLYMDTGGMRTFALHEIRAVR